MTMALRSRGIEAISLSGGQAGILTDASHGRARIASVEPQRVLDELDEGRTVVVAGFQGVTEQMDTTTLGRGASDLSAVAIAAGVGAERCEVYTDVEGIYTADPRLVPEARRLEEVSLRGDAGDGKLRRQDEPARHRAWYGIQRAHYGGLQLCRYARDADLPRSQYGYESRGDQKQGASHRY